MKVRADYLSIKDSNLQTDYQNNHPKEFNSSLSEVLKETIAAFSSRGNDTFFVNKFLEFYLQKYTSPLGPGKTFLVEGPLSKDFVFSQLDILHELWGQRNPNHSDAWYEAYGINAFDTGGYTGAWGPDGKLAMLHEKELVLNKDDTANFLRSLDFSNQMLDSIDRMANLMSVENYLQQVSAIFDKIGGMTDQIEQVVHIDAQFPNVRDSKDIEDALNNLINTAAQYAYRD